MADVKFSELDILSAADSGDIFAVVDTSASTSKKLSIDNLFGTIPVDVRVTDATDSSSTTTGSIRTAGGIGIVKALQVGTTSTLTGVVTIAAGLAPDASDGAYLGTSSLEFSDLFLADEAVISLGDGGADVTLTHVPDVGVTLNSTNKIMFNDASQFIQGVSATVLGLGATDEIDLTATAIDINGTVDMSGLVTIQTGMVPDASDGAYLGTSSLEWSDLYLADEAVLSFGDGGADVTLTHVADTGIQVNDTNKIMFHDASQFIQGVSATVLGLGATDEIDLTATAIDINGTVNASGLVTVQTGIVADAQDGAYLGTSSLQFSDLFLADGGTITMGDDAEVIITHVADSGITLSHETTGDNLPVILTLESSEAAVVVDEVIGQVDFKPTVGSADGAAVCAGIAAVAEGTFSDTNNAAKLSFKTAASEAAAEKMALSSTGILTVTGSVVPSADDGAALGSASLNWSDLFIADAGVINLGDDQDVTLTHVADTGLLLNSTRQLQFNDASQYISGTSATVLSIVATDEIDLTATAMDINGTVDMSGLVTIQTGMVPDASDGAYLGTTALQFSDIFLADAAVINLGDDQDVTLTHVADTGVLLNSDNVIQFRDSGLTIGSSADGTLDVVADTILDLDAATVTLTKAGANQVVKHATDAYDLAFQQADGDTVATIHDGATSATLVTNLELVAAAKGGFGYKRPVYKSTSGTADETVALTMAHSGALVQVIGSAYDMDYTLPAVASGDEGFHITFVISTVFSSSKNLEIATNGAAADNNDNIFMYMNTAGTSGVDVSGDTIITTGNCPAGTMIRMTCIIGGAAEQWVAEVFQPSGTAATTGTAPA